MVKSKLLLAMKLVAFRGHKKADMFDCRSLINKAISEGVTVSKDYLYSLVYKYYDKNVLSDEAKDFIDKVGR